MNLLMQVSCPLAATTSTPGALGGAVGGRDVGTLVGAGGCVGLGVFVAGGGVRVGVGVGGAAVRVAVGCRVFVGLGMVVGVLVGGCVGRGVALGSGAVGVAVIGAEQPMQPTISNSAARVKCGQGGNGFVTVTYLSRR